MLLKTGKFSIFSLPDSKEKELNETLCQANTFKVIFEKFAYKTSCDTSLAERKTIQKHISLTYGEISSIHPLKKMFECISVHGGFSKSGGKFYDLGSGIGRPVVAAAVLHNFDRCVGIEILSGLHKIAEKVKMEYGSICPNSPTVLDFICGSILDANVVDWTDGDVVYANSTCFDDSMMSELSTLGSRLRVGAYFITLSTPLKESDGFVVINEERFEMSW
jgi:hypothetical protein